MSSIWPKPGELYKVRGNGTRGENVFDENNDSCYIKFPYTAMIIASDTKEFDGVEGQLIKFLNVNEEKINSVFYSSIAYGGLPLDWKLVNDDDNA